MMAQASTSRGWRSLPHQMFSLPFHPLPRSAARVDRSLHRIKLGSPPLYGVRIDVTVTVIRTAETDLSRPNVPQLRKRVARQPLTDVENLG